MDFSNLSEALKGNTNAAGKHMMKLGNKLQDSAAAAMDGLKASGLGDMAKQSAFASAEALKNGRHKAADTIDQKGSQVGHQMRAVAEVAHARAQEMASSTRRTVAPHIDNAVKNESRTVRDGANAVMRGAKDGYAKVVPFIKHAQVRGEAAISSAGAAISRKIDEHTNVKMTLTDPARGTRDVLFNGSRAQLKDSNSMNQREASKLAAGTKSARAMDAENAARAKLRKQMQTELNNGLQKAKDLRQQRLNNLSSIEKPFHDKNGFLGAKSEKVLRFIKDNPGKLALGAAAVFNPIATAGGYIGYKIAKHLQKK